MLRCISPVDRITDLTTELQVIVSIVTNVGLVGDSSESPKQFTMATHNSKINQPGRRQSNVQNGHYDFLSVNGNGKLVSAIMRKMALALQKNILQKKLLLTSSIVWVSDFLNVNRSGKLKSAIMKK